MDGKKQYLAQLILTEAADAAAVARALSACLHPNSCVLRLEDDSGGQASHEEFDGWDLGRPSRLEAESFRINQQAIWGSQTDYLYPVTMHACHGGPGISYVVRDAEKPVAFLTGFIGFTDLDLPESWQKRFAGTVRLESQLLGVADAYRGRGLGVVLKKYQALQAAEAGIGRVSWTTDPLQFRNAGLNFKRLGAVAFRAYPNYLRFENELNRVAPSRLALTWLVKSRRVRKRLFESAQAETLPVREHPEIIRVNQGCDRADMAVDAERIAFEIPSDWTAVQNSEPNLASVWRQFTDELFVHYLGSGEGRYIITGVGEDEGRKFLIADRVTDPLLRHLAE